MLKDELELITGHLIPGSVTRTVFDMLNPSEFFDTICEDVRRMNRRDICVSAPDLTTTAGENFGSGFDIVQWLAREGQSVALPGDAADTT